MGSNLCVRKALGLNFASIFYETLLTAKRHMAKMYTLIPCGKTLAND